MSRLLKRPARTDALAAAIAFNDARTRYCYSDYPVAESDARRLAYTSARAVFVHAAGVYFLGGHATVAYALKQRAARAKAVTS